MLELTKTPRTDGLWDIHAVVPANRVEAVATAIAEASAAGVPASEVFPESTPGSLLRGARTLMGMTQKQLAEALGVTVPNLSGMENDKRPIGKAMAKKIGAALDFSYKVFL
jgi:DNA-binding XRE family transcriptional regulator